MKPKARNIMIVVVASGFVVFGCCGSLFLASRMQVGMGVTRSDFPREDKLPPNATNINYGLMAWGPVIWLEYDLSEADFLAWCQSQGWSPVQVNSVEVARLGVFSIGSKGTTTRIRIADAYQYTHSFPYPDATLQLTYDRTNNRCYYYENMH